VETTDSRSSRRNRRFWAWSIVTCVLALGACLTAAAVGAGDGPRTRPSPARDRPVAGAPANPAAGQPAPPGVSTKQTKPVPAYWKSSLADVQQCLAQVRKGKVEVLAQSAGGRTIHLVSYGRARDSQSQATYNSACGADNPAWYANKPAGTPPTVLLLGPVHGHEFEGIAGLIDLIHLVETGADLRGRPWPRLLENFQKCRVLIVPCANPDGRARVPLDSFVGEEAATNAYYGVGTFADGRPQGWPQVKQRQPMVGDVGFLGAYFNDAGVNLMHDDWFGRMAPETDAILDLARREAVDYGVSLHSHGTYAQMLQTDYMDPGCQEKVIVLSERMSRRFAGMKQRLSAIRRAAVTERPPGQRTPASFNLCSALHHVCGATMMLYENSCGSKGYYQIDHADILDLQMAFFEELLAFAAENPVVWKR